ncbi:MAG: hypothetical protein ACLSE6_02175 [Alphaproteobacteria bacterium]
MTEKVELIGLNKAELDRLMADIGEKAVSGQTAVSVAVCSGAVSFDEMTNLSKDLYRQIGR